MILSLSTLLPSWGKTPAKGPGQERLEAAKATFEAAKAAFTAGSGSLDPVYLWSCRWLSAQQESGVSGAAAVAAHLTRMKELEAAVKTKFESGIVSRTDKLAAAYYRAEAEFWAARKQVR